MQLTIYTERGSFTSKRIEDCTAAQMDAMKDAIQQCAAEGTYFTVETDSGYVVLGKDLLRTAAFEVHA